MRLIRDLRGHISLAAMGIGLILVLAAASGDDARAYSQLAAAEPSAAQQIWNIGNQPVGYLQDKQDQTQGEMWGQDASLQNIRFLSSNPSSVQAGQGDIWLALDAKAKSSQTSQTQGANSPLQQAGSTFSEPAPLSSFEMHEALTKQPEQGTSSWWSSAWDSVGSWGSGLYNDARSWLGFSNRAENPCPNGVCEAIGVRG